MKKTMLENLNEFLSSPEGMASAIKWAEQYQNELSHSDRWVDKCTKLLKSLDNLDDLYRKYIKHSEKRREILFKQGCDGNTSLARIVLNAFGRLGRTPSEDEVNYSMFTADIFEYKGYIAELFVGQGSFVAIYKFENGKDRNIP